MTSSIKEYKSRLKAIGAKTTHANKAAYQTYITKLEWYKTFPWRLEQTRVFDAVHTHQRIVVQGIFGVGKSSMLLGIIFKALIEDGYKPHDIVYTAFNVCVKNEIRKKFSSYGIRNKIQVYTFDSLIYKICKAHGCPNLDEPNYEGRRKFVYNIITTNNVQLIFTAKLLFLDECQDLEIQALGVFQTFFPKAKFIFVGDVLQSIQKEPRESLLWQLMKNDKYATDYNRICMYETPRVPVNILNTLRGALTQFYPEFSGDFDKWTSKNTTTAGKITWKQFKHYKQVFTDVLQFVNSYDHGDTMVLTFSSSITVRGALGDVSRIRNMLCENNIPVNFNHKSMEAKKVFLSTSNSSKGLERKHVLVVLTFPLEQAFMNFSSDLVMNLVTVAISRAIETVTIYVPITIQKFSPILKYYQDVPEPTVNYTPPSQKGKKGDTDTLQSIVFNMDTVMNKEHSVTEVLRLGVLKYETISHIKSFTKPIAKFKLVKDTPFSIHLFTDEERTLAGVFVEHLITTEWGNVWPTAGVSSLQDNPSYNHCFSKLESLCKLYNGMTHAQPFESSSVEYRIRVLHIYSQLMLGINHRIFVTLRESEVKKISDMWKNHWRFAIGQMKVEGKCKIQSNCKMPFMTGIIDMLVTSSFASTKTEGKMWDNCTFWEIKASTDPMWETDALSQAMLYVLMNAKSRCTVVLINPFRNLVCKYAVNIPNINTVRHLAMHDSIIYNANSLMAKTFKDVKSDASLDLLDTIFVNIQPVGDSTHFTVMNLFSPTKLSIVYHAVTTGTDSKLGLESKISLEKAQQVVDKLCKSSKVVFSNGVSPGDNTFEPFEYHGELFDTTDPFMQCIGNILHLFTTTKYVF